MLQEGGRNLFCSLVYLNHLATVADLTKELNNYLLNKSI